MNGEFLSSFASNLHYIVISNYLSGSGSTKVLNTDPIWIRIHNTAYSTSSILEDSGSYLNVLYIFGGILYELVESMTLQPRHAEWPPSYTTE